MPPHLPRRGGAVTAGVSHVPLCQEETAKRCCPEARAVVDGRDTAFSFQGLKLDSAFGFRCTYGVDREKGQLEKNP